MDAFLEHLWKFQKGENGGTRQHHRRRPLFYALRILSFYRVKARFDVTLGLEVELGPSWKNREPEGHQVNVADGSLTTWNPISYHWWVVLAARPVKVTEPPEQPNVVLSTSVNFPDCD